LQSPLQGNALDMLQDVNTGIAWVLRHAAAFGGDGESFHLVGQSVS
jgi:prenylcysteine alpha-carboxyl methylesterase